MCSPVFLCGRAVLTALCILVLAGSLFANTTIRLSAASAPPTGKFLVSGAGFPAHSVIDIYFDAHDSSAVKADAAGSFSQISIQAPASALPGKHWISAVARSGNTSAQISFTVQSDWTEFHKQNMRRWNGVENVLGVTSVKNLQLKWSFQPGQMVQSSPAIANGVIYFGANNGALYARDAATGASLWSFNSGANTLASSPAVANGVVYLGDDNGIFYALDASTGSLRWTYTTDGPSIESGAPAIVNGVIYTASQFGTLYALNTNGTLRWSFPTVRDDDYCSPVVLNGIVYFAGGDTNFYALNSNTGALIWKSSTGSIPGASAPAIANGVVYVGANDSNLYAFNASSGTLLWKFQAGGVILQGGPAVANGTVFVGASDGKVYAINATTGAKRWTFSTGALEIGDTPAVANGVVYIASDNGIFYALNANTGAKLWSTNRGAGSSSPAVVNGMVYVGTSSDLSAFGLKSAPAGLPTPPDIRTLHPDFRIHASSSPAPSAEPKKGN